MARRPLVLLLVPGLVAATLGVAGPVTPAAAEPATVTVAGSFQQELGCPGDWQPECAATHLTLDADDGVWQGSFPLPAGSWEYKAALDGTWDENYGAGAVRDGQNIGVSLGGPSQVKFFYDDETHWVTDNQTSVIATVPGSFQSELGCASDWDPGCLRSWLQDADGDGVGRFSTSSLPPGAYEAKVAIDEAWDENYGGGGVRDGANIPFTVGGAGDVVTFSYDQGSHVLDIAVTPATPVDDAALVREPVRHPFVDEVLYFAMPDRFNDGNRRNNCGAFAGACVAGDTQENVLAHGYLPSEKGYYHGGDLEGLRRKLPYLQGLGVTAIWVGPIFTNKPTQSDTTDLYGHSAGYHGYWIEDFLHVDPHLGTNAEFARLVDEAHDRDIKVVMDIVTNHTADVIQLEGNAGLSQQARLPLPRRRTASRSTTPTSPTRASPTTRSRRSNAGSFPYTPTLPPDEADVKNPAWLNDPLLYHNRGNTELHRRELAVRRLLRPRRPVDRAPRGGRGDGRHLLVLDRRVRRRRVPHRHHQAREHGVLAEVRTGHPRRRRGAGHRRLLRLRRGVRPAVRPAVHERVLDQGPAAVDDRLRLPARGAGLRLAERADRRPARLLRPRRLLHRRRQQRLRHADVPREPRHGAHRLLPPACRPGRRRRRRAAGPLPAGARPHVLRPGPAGRLLRRRAGLHRRRRRQGRPRGHVRQRRARRTRTTT